MKFGEVGCGAGGLGIGLTRAGFSCAGAWDIDPIAVATYRDNVSRKAEQLDISNLSLVGADLDVLAAGLPCEAFSTLGLMRPTDRRARLWTQFARLLEDSAPSAFVVENVPPFLGSRRCQLLVRRAERLGYQVTTGLVDAEAFGTPQLRRRAIVAGSRNGKVELEPARRAARRTVRDAIGDLPRIPDGKNGHDAATHAARTLERFAHVPPGGDWRDLPHRLQNPCWHGLTSGAVGVFGRLRWGRPSQTVRTTFLKPETGRYIHPSEDRGLTLREGARLQGFGDDFVFLHGSKDQRARVIGRAVPPPVAEGIARNLRAAL